MGRPSIPAPDLRVVAQGFFPRPAISGHRAGAPTADIQQRPHPRGLQPTRLDLMLPKATPTLRPDSGHSSRPLTIWLNGMRNWLMTNGFICPVYGYPDSESPAYDAASGSWYQEICPSCGTQFGYDDARQGHARTVAAGLTTDADRQGMPLGAPMSTAAGRTPRGRRGTVGHLPEFPLGSCPRPPSRRSGRPRLAIDGRREP